MRQRGLLRLIRLASIEFGAIALMVAACFLLPQLFFLGEEGRPIIFAIVSIIICAPIVVRASRRRKGKWPFVALVAVPLLVYRLARLLNVLMSNMFVWQTLVFVAAVSILLARLVTDGYLLEQARLAIFGVDHAPQHVGDDIRRYLLSGWRGFVVTLVHRLVPLLVACVAFVALLPALTNNAMGIVLFGLLVLLYDSVLTVVVLVLRLHTVTFRSTKSGFAYAHTEELASQDMGGLLRIYGMRVFLYALLLICGVLICYGALDFVNPSIRAFNSEFATLPQLVDESGLNGETQLSLLNAMTSAGTIFFNLALAASPLLVLRLVCTSMLDAATGLWMRQFAPATWKGVYDLPGEYVDAVSRATLAMGEGPEADDVAIEPEMTL